VDEDLGIEIPDKLFFRIGEVAQLVSVEPHVLRYWESEFRMRPTRSRSGQRMYRQKDIARFIRIKRLLHEQGYTIAGARKALSDRRTPTVSAPEEGGDAPANASGVRDALTRLEAARSRIVAMRRRVSEVGPSPVDAESADR
jgi:DNA-binding transcriptional MerR regulator